MFKTLNTLFRGASARAEERVKDQFAIELIDQKIREATASLKAAKATLAGIIQRERTESRQLEALEGRITELTLRAKEALAAGDQSLAEEAAAAIAAMENEARVREETLKGIRARTIRLQSSVETANRRILDLKQSATVARSVHRERAAQGKLSTHLDGVASIDEAEELVARVMGQDDPFEQSEILREIDAGLSHASVEDRLEGAGYGPATKSTASDVLKRLAT